MKKITKYSCQERLKTSISTERNAKMLFQEKFVGKCHRVSKQGPLALFNLMYSIDYQHNNQQHRYNQHRYDQGSVNNQKTSSVECNSKENQRYDNKLKSNKQQNHIREVSCFKLPKIIKEKHPINQAHTIQTIDDYEVEDRLKRKKKNKRWLKRVL